MAGLFSKSGLFYEAGSNSGGGSDPHNLGWYETPTALSTAHPTAVAGDWAIVGSTDTVWVWDTDTSAWVDTDTKGQVTSVNNQTGAVTLTASDVGALPDNTHIPADPVQADWNEADSAALDYIKNKPTIPAAQVNSDWNANSGVAQILNKPTLGTMAAESANDYTKTANLATVATTGAYSDLSGTPTIPTVNNATLTITQGGVTKGTFTANAGTDVTIAVDAGSSLPSQTGNAGKFLTTDGTAASWGNTPVTVNDTYGSINVGSSYSLPNYYANIMIGTSAQTNNTSGNIAIGRYANAQNGSISIGNMMAAGTNSIAILGQVNSDANYAIQLGCGSDTNPATNTNANTFKVANANGNFEIMSADGTIPTDRFTTTPSADGTYVPTLTISSGTATRTWGAPAGGLPSQTGQSGKFLITDGTDASWSNGTTESLYFKNSNSNMTGARIYSSGGQVLYVCAVQSDGTDNGYGYSFGVNTFRPEGPNFNLGESVAKWGTTYTTKLNNGGNITVPAVAGSMSVQVSSMPTASSTLEGQIYQFTGTTDSTYTNGRFYKCVSDGQATPTYSWEEVSMGGGSSYTAGTGIDITGGVISVTTPAVINKNSSTANGALYIDPDMTVVQPNGGRAIGILAPATGDNSICIGDNAKAQAQESVSIGYSAQSNSSSAVGSVSIGSYSCAKAKRSIQLGSTGSYTSNNDANTFKVANENGNFEIMSANGTIPTDRFTTTPVSDGTYVPTLTISSGVATRSWAAPGGGGATSATATLAVADWSSNTQTVNVTGVTASNNVIVAAAPASQSDYASFGVLCTAQGAGTLTFTCTTTPTNAITVNVLII